MSHSARVAFCILFTLTMLEAWVLRDFAQPLLEQLPCALRTWISLRRRRVRAGAEAGLVRRDLEA